MNYQCPKCSSEFIVGTKFCKTCGCNLELEFIEKPTCPKCKATYPPNTKFCLTDGSKLFRPEELVPKCVICNTTYYDDTKFCPRDGGEIKIILPQQFTQPVSYVSSSNLNQNIQNSKYPPVSSGNRLVAALLDGLIFGILSIPAYIFYEAAKRLQAENNDNAVGGFLLALALYLIPAFYGLFRDGFGQGQSLGKKAMNVMVISLDDNKPCGFGKSFLRNIVPGIIVHIPYVGWIILIVTILATGRSIGDMVAKTQLIDKNQFVNN